MKPVVLKSAPILTQLNAAPPDVLPELLQIKLFSHHPFHNITSEYYEKIILANLNRLLKERGVDHSAQQKVNILKSYFPIVSWECIGQKPFFLTIRCIYNYRQYSSRFIYDIVSRWLLPGKRLNIVSQFGSDFIFNTNPDESFIFLEMNVCIETTEDLKTIQKTMPMIASEIRVGVKSIIEGLKILEIKGLSIDDKMSLVQESIVSLMNQKPDHFDYRLFSEMQRFLVFSGEAFQETREYRHLVRLICWQYLFRKATMPIDSKESNRLLRVKLMKTRLHYPYGAKTVLGVLVGVNQVKENEKFGEAQILQAVQISVPKAKPIAQSFLSNQKLGDLGAIIYAEFEKEDHSPFTYEELTKLRMDLPLNLKGNIEQFMHPIFMPRNDEEVMRNILHLSKQLKNSNDIPQVIISFDSQSQHHITYSFVLLRVVKSDDLSVQNLCSVKEFKYELIPDRIKIVGHIKRRYVKEANVFYVRLDKQTFLRKDYSLDLYKARQAILDELFRVFDDVRDFNGGMIAKENELFTALKHELKEEGENYSELLLENFFYNITPVIARSLMDLSVLKTAFQLLLRILENPLTSLEKYVLKYVYQSKYIYAYVISSNLDYDRNLSLALNDLKFGRFQLIHSQAKTEDTFYKVIIFHSERIEERKQFCDTIYQALKAWSASQVSRIA